MKTLFEKLGLGVVTRFFSRKDSNVAATELCSPVRDWKIIFTLLCVGFCTLIGFAALVYVEVGAGTFAEATPLSSKAPESLDQTELARVNALFTEREKVHASVLRERVTVPDPSK